MQYKYLEKKKSIHLSKNSPIFSCCLLSIVTSKEAEWSEDKLFPSYGFLGGAGLVAQLSSSLQLHGL